MAKHDSLTFKTSFSLYSEIEQIGEGGCGRVYKANDADGMLFAIKILDAKKATKDKLKRFKNELSFCSDKRHSNIIYIIDHGLIVIDGNELPFYVMPYYDSSLRKLMKKGIAHDKILQFFSQILDGVEAAHYLKVIHRDLKPENILFNEKENKLVIADFGIAHFEEEYLATTIETHEKDRLANFQYAAPEQRIAGRQVTISADIYSLGLILNEMFTGEIPLGTGYRSISSADKNYEYLDTIVDKMIRQNPVERFSNVEGIKKELIGRKNEMVVLQELNAAKNKVIKENEILDPIFENPIKLIGVDWKDGKLELKLSSPVNQKWIWAIQNMGGYSSVLGKGPEAFQFHGDTAIIASDANSCQRIIDYFKGWLPIAHRVYEERIKRDKEEDIRKQREAMKNEIDRKEERVRVINNLKI